MYYVSALIFAGVLSLQLAFGQTINPPRVCLNESELMPGVKIDGRKRDLITFTYKGKTYTDPIRDGDYMLCETIDLVVPGINIGSAKKKIPGTDYGTYVLPGADREKPFRTYPVGGDVSITPNHISIRHGRLRDLVTAYGIIRDQNGRPVGLSPIKHTPRDGEHNWVTPWGSSFVHTYGDEKDLHTRFCFDGVQWYRSPGNSRDQPFPMECSITAENEIQSPVFW